MIYAIAQTGSAIPDGSAPLNDVGSGSMELPTHDFRLRSTSAAASPNGAKGPATRTNRRKSSPAKTAQHAAEPAVPQPASSATQEQQARPSKTDLVLKKLRLAKGATVTTLIEATGWQAHSVRGFISGTVKKKLGLNIVAEVGKDGLRRYRIVDPGKAA